MCRIYCVHFRVRDILEKLQAIRKSEPLGFACNFSRNPMSVSDASSPQKVTVELSFPGNLRQRFEKKAMLLSARDISRPSTIAVARRGAAEPEPRPRFAHRATKRNGYRFANRWRPCCDIGKP